jgi:hypothetical protein
MAAAIALFGLVYFWQRKRASIPKRGADQQVEIVTK